MRARLIIVFLTVMSLLLSSCSLSSPSDEASWTGKVGEGEVRVEVGQATIVFPDEVAPPGTKATVRLLETERETRDAATTLSDSVEVTLENGLQPQRPVQITLPIELPDVSAEKIHEEYLLFVSAAQADGSESFASGTFDAVTGSYTVSVEHFSSFKVWGIDLGSVMTEVKTAVLQGLGIEFPAPECVGTTATVNGRTYEADQTSIAHLCLEEKNGSLVITAQPAVAMPYLVTSEPEVLAQTSADDVSLSTAGIIALARGLDFIGTDSRSAVFPGSVASYTFTEPPNSVELDFEQYPVLLLMVILGRTFDALGILSNEELENLQCLADVAETGSPVNQKVNGQTIGAFTKAFLSCVERFGELSAWGKFLTAAIGTVPAVLTTSGIGIMNEIKGESSRTVSVSVAQPRLSAEQLLNATLPANACWTGDYGWEHSQPIQLSNGQGEARSASGEFGDAAAFEAKVLGAIDLDEDGLEEVVLSYRCTGTPLADCCAGRSSTATTVGVFRVGEGSHLTSAAPILMRGFSYPGDASGPASRQISTATLEGRKIVTSEYIVYPENYSSEQVGGDPTQPVKVEYQLQDGAWQVTQR